MKLFKESFGLALLGITTFCAQNAWAACTTNADCATDPVGPVCNTGTSACGPCVTNADCVGNVQGPRCDPIGTCGPECVNDSMCAGNPKGPVCNTAANTCGPQSSTIASTTSTVAPPTSAAASTTAPASTAVAGSSTTAGASSVAGSPPAGPAGSSPAGSMGSSAVGPAGTSPAGPAASSPAGSTTQVNPPASGYTGTPNLAAQGIQTFGTFENVGTGQSVNVEIIDANGNRVVYLLTSLGCKSIPAGQSPFTDGTSPAATSKQTCVTTCGLSFRLNAYVGTQCYCGSTLRDLPTVPCPTVRARLMRRQGSNTAQIIQVNPPTVPISSSTSSSSTSTSRSSGTSTSTSTSTSTGISTSTGTNISTSTPTTRASTSTNTNTGTGATSTGASSPTSAGTTPSMGPGVSIPDSDPATSLSMAPTASGMATINPINVGGFTYLGCYGSSSSFPTFVLSLSAEAMTNDRCIAQCAPTGKRYAATFGRDCFCGDFMDDVNQIRTPEDQCNLSCPGNSRQRCGGRATDPVLKAKRQLPGVISAVVRFSIYVRAGAAPGAPSGTITTTITTTVTGRVATITTAYCPYCHDCKGPFCHKPSNPYANGECSNIPCFGDDCYKTIVGYGEYCAFDFPCFGPECGRRLVHTDGVWRPEACSGFDCGRRVKCVSGKCGYVVEGMAEWHEKVTCYGNCCYVEKCAGDACNKKYVCKDNSCIFESCSAKEALNKYEWSGDQYTIVKGCDGNCPKPQPPCADCGIVISQAPVTQTVCNGASCNTVVVPQPPITKTPYQTGLAPVQPPVITGLPTVVSPGTTKPVNVVTAGTSKFAAGFGAFAFSVIAAALLL
ncbi:WSC domain-containing protein [Colletotrichum truncatum]|uniref:WSC domain-containing protein n=1 Tax=Colletotrichum truncatum TaxID=5467 RepID=A0ACC3ZF76_COLTU|nr:WSC domain-containing protein [Colletotrichum truncatum]KAF6801639.1 WSC domain-containing protein [Colletotrichum truncatum]